MWDANPREIENFAALCRKTSLKSWFGFLLFSAPFQYRAEFSKNLPRFRRQYFLITLAF